MQLLNFWFMAVAILGSHLEYLKMPNDVSWASFRFLIYTTYPTKINNNLVLGVILQGIPSGNWTRLFSHSSMKR